MSKRYKLLKSKKLPENKSLKEDKIEGKFSDMAGQIGLRTCKELEDFLEREGYAGALETLKSIMLDYLTYELDDLDFIAKDESLKEGVDKDNRNVNRHLSYMKEIPDFFMEDYDYRDYQGEIIIPDGVTSIGGYAFEDCSGITSVTIPKGVKYIGSGAFKGCSGLKSVTIPIGVTKIGEFAFEDCEGLTSVTISNSVRSIGDFAFDGCIRLTDVTIGNNVTSIGKGAFFDCLGLISITYKRAIVDWKNINKGSDWRVSRVPESCIVHCTDGDIGLFESSKDESLKESYQNVDSMSREELMDEIDGIYEWALKGKHIDITSIIEDPEVFPNDKDDEEGYFKGVPTNKLRGILKILRKMKSGGSLTKDDQKVFLSKDGSINESATGCLGAKKGDKILDTKTGKIGEVKKEGQVDNYNLIYVDFGNGLRKINPMDDAQTKGRYQFADGDDSLNESISKSDRDIIIDAVKGEFETGHGYMEDKDEFEEMIGRRLTRSKYEELKDFYSELQDLGPEGFYEEYKDKLEFDPDFVEEYGHSEDDEYDDLELDEDMNKSLKEDAAEDDADVKNLTNLKTIPDEYMSGSDYKGEIIIPNSITSIGEEAFRGCSGITSITIPDSVTRIGKGAFNRCSGIKSITIPDSVKSIGGYAFFRCTGLSSIEIPDSVSSIGDGAFDGCYGLKSVTIGSSVTYLGWGAFKNCYGLKSITIPGSVTSINPEEFQYCDSLTSIDIPNSVTEIGKNAFNGCTKLKNIMYKGTIAEWKDTPKWYGWNEEVPKSCTIHCTDGDISLSGKKKTAKSVEDSVAKNESVNSKSKGKYIRKTLSEDTIQKKNGKWTNRGKDGQEHGEFDTKEEADAQRKAMFARGFKG